ncbi:MAG: Autotransporter-associated beta strand repeat protein [Planctomycetes bacterium ADurb.Bin126]|nr:MAG: Autotransporter-associated beta strand repeat protein [Planctomycetes bacterium ADurb.Bin126]
MNTYRSLVAGVAIVLLLGLTLPSARAATWIGVTADMATATNWSPSGVPSAAASDPMLFDGSSTQNVLTFNGATFSANPGMGSITIAAGQTAGLSITNAGATGQVFRLSPGANLAIESGAGAFALGGSGSSFYLNLANSSIGNRFTNNSANLATIASPATINASGGIGGYPTFDGPGDWLVSATISNAITRGLVKDGNGLLTLSGNNAYTGGTTVNAGTLKLGNNAALGATGSQVIVADGAMLDLNGSITSSRDYAAVISGSGIGGAGAIVNNVTDRNYGFKSLTLTGDATIGGTKRWDIRPGSGQASLDLAGYTLTKTGSNFIPLVDGTLSSPGTINVDQGIFGITRSEVSGAGAINVASGARLRFESSTKAVSKAITLTSATLDVISTDATITSTIGLTGANTVDVQTSRTFYANGQISGTGGLTKIGGGTLVLGSANTYSGATALNAGALMLVDLQAMQNSDLAVADGTSLLLRQDAGGTFAMASLKWGGNVILDVGAAGVGPTDNTLTLPNAQLTGSGTYSFTNSTGDGYKLAIGTIDSQNTSPTFSAATEVSIAGISASNTGRLNTYTFTGAAQQTVGAILKDPATSWDLNIVKNGTGALVLNGASTYGGTTTVNDGTLRLAHTAGAGTGTINLGNATLSLFRSGATTTYANAITSTAGTAGLLTLDGSGSNAGTGTNSIYDTGTLTVSGTLTVARKQGGTGHTQFIDILAGNGTLVVDNTNGGAAPSTSALGRAMFNNSGNTFSGTVQILDGGNFMNLATAPTYSAVDIAAGGYMSLIGGRTTTVGALTGAGSITKNTVNDTATLRVGNGNVSCTFDGIIAQNLLLSTGTVALTKIGSGTLTLTGASTYTGTTTLNNGTLAMDPGAVIGNGTGTLDFRGDGGPITFRSVDASTITIPNPLNLATNVTWGSAGTGDIVFTNGLNGGGGAKTMAVNNAFTTIQGVIIGNTNPFTKAGPGTLVLTNPGNTFTKPMIVSEGTLLVNGSIATSPSVTVNAGATLGGYGAVPGISGAGLVSPGASPGILTSPSVNPAGGLDFAFEYTDLSPEYGSPSDSDNDVLWLTGGIDASLTSANEISLYFDLPWLAPGDVYTGGFFIEGFSGDLLAKIAGAQFTYYITGDGLGTLPFGGKNYYLLNGFSVDYGFEVGVAYLHGALEGEVMALTATVPEPATMGLLLLASAGIGGYVRRRKAA